MRLMRSTPLWFLLPQLAFASAAEDIDFYALQSNHQILKIQFLDNPQPWSNHQFVYGSKQLKPFTVCWVDRLKEQRQHFSCSPAKGEKSNLVYRVVGHPEEKAPSFADTTPAAVVYQHAAKIAGLGDGNKLGDGTLLAIYECQQGCSKSLPRYVFEVAHLD